MVVKSIFTSIFALFLVSNFVYGSQNVPKKIRCYTIADIKKSVKAKQENGTSITTQEMLPDWNFSKNNFELITNDAILKDETTPPRISYKSFISDRSSLINQAYPNAILPHDEKGFINTNQISMQQSQRCLEHIGFYISENFNRQKLFIHRPGNELYLDSVPKKELRDRIMLYEQSCGKRWIGDSDSEDEIPANKRQRTKS